MSALDLGHGHGIELADWDLMLSNEASAPRCGHVLDCRKQDFDVIAEVAEPDIAGTAKQPADSPGRMVMINVQPELRRIGTTWLPAADRAPAVLFGGHRLVLLQADAVRLAQPLIKQPALAFTRGTQFAQGLVLKGAVAPGIALPVIDLHVFCVLPAPLRLLGRHARSAFAAKQMRFLGSPVELGMRLVLLAARAALDGWGIHLPSITASGHRSGRAAGQQARFIKQGKWVPA